VMQSWIDEMAPYIKSQVRSIHERLPCRYITREQSALPPADAFMRVWGEQDGNHLVGVGHEGCTLPPPHPMLPSLLMLR
jgi:hypothetical protein